MLIGQLTFHNPNDFVAWAMRVLPTSTTSCLELSKTKLISVITWPSTLTAPCSINLLASLDEAANFKSTSKRQIQVDSAGALNLLSDQ